MESLGLQRVSFAGSRSARHRATKGAQNPRLASKRLGRRSCQNNENRVPKRGPLKGSIRVFIGYIVGALIIRIEFWGPVYYNFNKEPPKWPRRGIRGLRFRVFLWFRS